MTKIAFDDHPPDLPHVTPYDLRLLDADEEGADWRFRSRRGTRGGSRA